MRYFLLTAENKEFYVEAEWSEQAVEYFKWVRSFDGEVKVREFDCPGEVDFFCPAGWNVPITSGSELARNHSEWLRNYLGKFYETYENGVETPEFIEYMTYKGWKRECPYFGNEMDKYDDFLQEYPDASYTNPEHIWGGYPIILQAIKEDK